MQPALPGLDIQRPGPPPELVEQARAYIAGKEWKCAKTMPENPHHYVVFPFQTEGLDEGQRQMEMSGWNALRELIATWGWNRRWHGSTWRTYTLDGYWYWTIHPVINRKPSAEAAWED